MSNEAPKTGKLTRGGPVSGADGAVSSPADATLDHFLAEVQARTSARVLVGRCGPAYRTQTQLELRRDHAAALDAVMAELDIERDLGAKFCAQHAISEVQTEAAGKHEFLMRPDLGRRLSPQSKALVSERCPREADLQIVVGDGLSAAAVARQVPRLLPLLIEQAEKRGLAVGRPLVVRHCRVGVLNDVGELLDPAVAVFLIGERPGLATAESLSAYMAYRPRAGHTDAKRNLISNIHERGVSCESAALRIVALAEKMIALKQSGVAVKEDLPEIVAIERQA
ncbi:MAG: ethanolamine ammonia-lyase subunit EutC [Planctomycetia bacterium]|nr:ethanolamine ammonia-lyase subunit EutC [Planctomycetia bacterium]